MINCCWRIYIWSTTFPPWYIRLWYATYQIQNIKGRIPLIYQEIILQTVLIKIIFQGLALRYYKKYQKIISIMTKPHVIYSHDRR
jgi:hypothetical protein